MVCTANDLLGWTDFPKGLRVLLLDEDSSSAAELRLKLEEMNYIVSMFCDEDEALTAISDKPESFHVAIVEVSTGNSHGRFKFLEVATDLPTIMTSNTQCLTTMMKCITLGAVEFLLKPLSDDKLRNIWQHVVHKAFNAGGKDLSESLKPVKESMVSMLRLQLENGEPMSGISVKEEHETVVEENKEEHDKYPAPPTPQLEQGVRLVDDGDCQDQINCLTEKEGGDQDGEYKSVDTTCENLDAETTVWEIPPQISEVAVIKDEDESLDGCKSESNVSSRLENKDGPSDSGGDAANLNKASGVRNSCGNKANRKKMKKYRMQRRHILPKEVERRWPHPRDPSQRSYHPHKPVMAFPPYHSNPTLPAAQVYPAWGPPRSYASGVQMWGPAFYPPWQPTESWHWKPYPGMHADAWGCPVMPPPPPHGPYPSFPQNANGFNNAYATHSSYMMPPSSVDLQAADEVIDKVVKEAINKRWLPLPIGLKPPSTDSVLTELSRQGISTIPPHLI
ncbi:two-component response regulator-like APRR2 isoform X2 [Camellia sinensis]|uniref:two-component response regulator-like APRR2 isoform X2 n=1 Tax=Camellia sinensis TaxID=4442 RepID=UPI001036A2F0|nr:two-component response regulator-like APRR2 isoform X2 [Camellia sinensis]